MHRLALVLLLVTAAASPGFADEKIECPPPWKMNNLEALERNCLKAAQKGDREAQFRLAFIYHVKRSVLRNYPKAARWYRRAADQGHTRAQFYLGSMYGFGEGMPRSDVEAVKWYRKAAELGYAPAQFVLARSYAVGSGVPKNYIQAYVWYVLAASQDRNFRDGTLRVIEQTVTPASLARAKELAAKKQREIDARMKAN